LQHALQQEDVPIFTGSSEQVKMTTPYHVWQHIFEEVLTEDGRVKKFPELKDDTLPLLNAVHIRLQCSLLFFR
jgi:hypothetical protein